MPRRVIRRMVTIALCAAMTAVPACLVPKPSRNWYVPSVLHRAPKNKGKAVKFHRWGKMVKYNYLRSMERNTES